MKGTHRLNRRNVNRVTGEVSTGQYRLTRSRTGPTEYVGRSDTDLSRRLNEHLDEGYTHFRYSPAGSVKSAYEKECRQYHYRLDNGNIDNVRHPARPRGTNYRCPVCGR